MGKGKRIRNERAQKRSEAASFGQGQVSVSYSQEFKKLVNDALIKSGGKETEVLIPAGTPILEPVLLPLPTKEELIAMGAKF